MSKASNYLTVSQAADYLGLTPVRVRQFCQQGRIGEKVGNFWLIPRGELRRFSRKSRTPGNPNKK
jgi:excisionase family DNA binding protein